jgi:hypothetical protein
VGDLCGMHDRHCSATVKFSEARLQLHGHIIGRDKETKSRYAIRNKELDVWDSEHYKEGEGSLKLRVHIKMR